MRSEREIREWIVDKEAEYEDDREVLEQIDELPPHQQRSCYDFAYLSSANVAVYRLWIGDRSEASRWFERAADHMLQRALVTTTHTAELGRPGVQMIGKDLTEAVVNAVLSRSSGCLEEVTSEILELDSSVRDLIEENGGNPLTFDTCKLLAAVSAGQDELASEYVEQVRTTATDSDSAFSSALPGENPPLAGACEGLLDGDAAAVTDAVEAMLAAHDENVGDDPRGFREIVDRTAAAMLVLARDRGLDVTVDSRYVPDALFDDE